jgi:NAD(P)-dependent dehydrogenase (short-subunit alcohol dehydrogenase family)
MKGKVVIVTGGGAGIGKAITQTFTKEGAIVIVATKSKPETTCGEYLQTDVSDAESVKKMIEKVAKKHKKIDLLVNNAGIMPTGDLETTTKDTWDKTIATNLTGIFLCSKYSLPYLKKTKGNIINISSILGLIGTSRLLAYCASKGGVTNMTRAMAIDLSKEGIRVNCICPGPIMTKMLTEIYTQQELEQIKQITLLKRIGKPEEVAELALYLAKAQFVTGGIYTIDGGITSGID